MKILQVCQSFSPCFQAGGVVNVVSHISKKLVENKHDVVVYTTDGCIKRLNVKTNSPTNQEGVIVYYFRNISNLLKRKFKIVSPYYLFKIAPEIKNLDIIHIHEHRTMLAVITYYYARKYKKPYIIQAHGSVLPFLEKQNLKKVFDLVWGDQILKNASLAIALTRTESEQYTKMGIEKSKIKIIPNGIDLSEYESLPERGSFRSKYGIKSNEKIVLYVGRIHKSKGIDLLIDSYSGVLKQFENSKLVIVGPYDTYKDDLDILAEKVGISNNILYTGFVNKDEKMAAFVDADVFVTPLYSGFPITFLESCACGTPIVTTNKADELEWIQDKVGVVANYNSKDLKSAICKILNNNQLKRDFGTNGKQLVNDDFNWDIIVKLIIKSYESTLLDTKPEHYSELSVNLRVCDKKI